MKKSSTLLATIVIGVIALLGICGIIPSMDSVAASPGRLEKTLEVQAPASEQPQPDAGAPSSNQGILPTESSEVVVTAQPEITAEAAITESTAEIAWEA